MGPCLRLAVAIAAFIAALAVQIGRAQGLYGSLVGGVTDPSTASVPGAKVKITLSVIQKLLGKQNPQLSHWTVTPLREALSRGPNPFRSVV